MFIIPLTEMTPLSVLNTVSETQSAENSDDTKQSFEDTLKAAIQNVKDIEAESNQASYDLAMGYTDDIEGTLIKATYASSTIEMATQITTRAVNAYKEILQMQI